MSNSWVLASQHGAEREAIQTSRPQPFPIRTPLGTSLPNAVIHHSHSWQASNLRGSPYFQDSLSRNARNTPPSSLCRSAKGVAEVDHRSAGDPCTRTAGPHQPCRSIHRAAPVPSSGVEATIGQHHVETAGSLGGKGCRCPQSQKQLQKIWKFSPPAVPQILQDPGYSRGG